MGALSRAALLATLAACASARGAPPEHHDTAATADGRNRAAATMTTTSPMLPIAGDAALRRRMQDTVRLLLEQAVADSAFPGAFAVIGTKDGVIASFGAGRLDWSPSPAPDEHTLWDLASLTKVVGTTSAVMQLVEAGRLALDAPVQRYLPQWTGRHRERVTIRHLLTHSAGLPSWRPLHKESTSAEGALALALATELDTVPGARMVYSDLGIVVLSQVVERVTGQPLDAWLAREVFEPLGMRETMYRPAPALRERIAPTEWDPWRQRHLRGEVHDENAFALGGVAGHAGLFSTAHDLARFARMYLNRGTLDGRRVLPAAMLDTFTRVQDPALSHRALGWETPTGRNSAGTLLSARAFGHTGFTGTSLWMDPGRDLFVLLLSNRVNPSRQNTRISAVRVRLADAAATVLGPATSSSTPSPP